jgi:hypothetical protein
VGSFFLQKNSFLLLLMGIFVVSGSLVYLFISSNGFTAPPSMVTPTTTGVVALKTQPSQLPPPKPCSSKRRDFPLGIAYPDWGTPAYGESDTTWLTELQNTRTQTASCWMEKPILLHQGSLTSTTVTQGSSTSSVASFVYGVRFAHSLGLHIFVTAQLQASGPEPWSGKITFSTYQQEQQWFQMNWGSLQRQPPSWMRNWSLKMIGVSASVPLVDIPEQVKPKQLPSLWKKIVKLQLDNFSKALAEPLFISEIGYPHKTDALYHPWDTTGTAPPDPAQQADACAAALANIIPDPHILGSFFWGWDNVGDHALHGLPATRVIHSYYTSLQA